MMRVDANAEDKSERGFWPSRWSACRYPGSSSTAPVTGDGELTHTIRRNRGPEYPSRSTVPRNISTGRTQCE